MIYNKRNKKRKSSCFVKRFLVLSLGAFLASGMKVSASVKIQQIDVSEIGQIVTAQWEDTFFETANIVPHTSVAEVDGETVELTDEFEMSYKDARQATRSSESIEKTFEEMDGIYETQVEKDGSVTVSAPYQTKRIVVHAKVTADYGQSATYYLKEYNLTILQFDSEEKTQKADARITEDHYVDQIVKAQSHLQSVTWGAKTLELDGLKDSLPNQIVYNNKVKIAVIDTGLNTEDPLFEGRTISGYNVIDGNTDFKDVESQENHGTHVARILADSTPDNVEIYMLKVFDAEDDTSSDLVIDCALRMAISQGVDAINMSLGWETKLPEKYTIYSFLDKAIDLAYEAKIPVVTAAGNLNVDITMKSYPSNHPKTIAVGALSRSNGNYVKAGYSSYGDMLDFCAPGTNLECDCSLHQKSSSTGTSFSAPYITSEIAYLKMIQPESTVSEVYNQLKAACVDLGTPGKDKEYGWGYPVLTKIWDDLEQDIWTADTKESACEESGNVHYIYTASGEEIDRQIPATGHSWESVEIVEDEIELTCFHCDVKKRYPKSGTLGNISYEFSLSEYDDINYISLELSGDGDIPDLGAEEFPWNDFRDIITSIKISDGITVIPAYAFADCYQVLTVDLSANSKLRGIGDYAFANLSILNTIRIPKLLFYLGNHVFDGCRNIRYEVNSGLFMVDAAGNLVKKPSTPVKPKPTVIPSSVRYMGGVYQLKGGVAILKYTLSKKIAILRIPSAIPVYGRYYPVTQIGKKAVRKRTRLKKVVIGKNVKTIGAYAFDGCKRLKVVKFQGKVLKAIKKGAFRNHSSKLRYYMPASKKAKYRKLIKRSK